MSNLMTNIREGGDPTEEVVSINGRRVLQPAAASWNRIRTTLGKSNSLEKPHSPSTKSSSIKQIKVKQNISAGRGQSVNVSDDVSSFKSSSTPATPTDGRKNRLDRKKLMNVSEDIIAGQNYNSTVVNGGVNSEVLPVNVSAAVEASLSYSSSLILESPGSIAAVRREHMAQQQAQRKKRIAHYGRSKSAKLVDEVNFSPVFGMRAIGATGAIAGDENGHRRCSFITPSSDLVYVAYHDQEWGVPVHDDRMLFELLVLCGAQVGTDWTSILKRRQNYRCAFAGFDPETVANLSDKQMQIISAEHGIEISLVRGVVDNANRIAEIMDDIGSFDKYIWAFVNNKPISTNYRFGHKVPVKTSKSDCISKDLVKRGFRFVGPTAVLSFMQAAGLTNDHLVTCHRHLQCALAAQCALG